VIFRCRSLEFNRPIHSGGFFFFRTITGTNRGCPISIRLQIVILLGLLTIEGAFAQPAQSGKGAGPRIGPVSQVEVTITNRTDLDRLVQAGYDVDGVKNDRVTIYADADELATLSAGGWQFEVLKSPPAPPGTEQTKALGVYNGYADMTAMLDAYAANYPSVCRKISIGKSVQNRELWAMKITANPDVPSDRPKFKYISTMHGNEPVGTEMCLYLIDRLLTGYASNDTRIVNLVTNVEIWFLPLMNPDGRESSSPQRYNANGYDLNRSFPEGAGNNFGNWLYGPTSNTNGLQPEVRQVLAWTLAQNFSLGANFHSGALVANYPYDNDNMGSVYSPSPDESLFQTLSRTYSSNNVPMWNSPFFTQGIVNGAEWYAITGGMQDWNYRYAGCFDLTIELSDGQWPDPPANQLATYWSQNQESMLAYLEWSLRGVRGIIRSAQTGQPVAGAVRVEGFHHLMFSDPDVGDYHRLLLPGTYTLWFYAPGFVPQRISNVVVSSGNATRVDVALQPVSLSFALKVNFQPAAATVPAGYRVDSGAAFGDRGNGYTYGWEITLPGNTILTRNAGRSQDLRYDTVAEMQGGGNHVWEVAVPSGPYRVHVAAGDPSRSNGLYRVMAEGNLLLDGAPNVSNRWVEAIGTVLVTDGRLTISNGTGASSNRLAFLEISATEPTTIEQWRALYFGTTNNAGSAANNSDPDGDGFPNLMEYGTSRNPTIADIGPVISPVQVHTNNTDWFGCWFLRNTNATDVSFYVQTTAFISSLTWSNVVSYSNCCGWTGPGLARESAVASNVVSVTALDSQPVLGSTNRFMRLKVTQP
jgi:carboxypeptidase D